MTNESLKSKTVKGILWGGISNGIQQLLGFIFGIFLSRILTRYDYGLLATIMIFGAIASAFQESGFVNGIANKKEVQNKDYNAVFWASTTIGTTLYIILFFCAPFIAQFFDKPELTALARVVFLSFWVSSFGIAHNAYLFRNMMIRERAMSTLSALTISNLTGIYLAFQDYGYWALAIQTVLYSSIVNLMFIYFSKFRPLLKYDITPIRDIFGFSSKILITNVFIHINNNIHGFIFGKFYRIEDVGDVNQSTKWNNMSQSVIGNIVSQLTQPLLRKVHEDQERHLRVFRKLLSFTAFLSFPMLFGLSLLSDDFIFITIGDKWVNSAHYLSILAIGGAFAVINTGFSNLVLSFGKSNIYMWNIITFGLLQVCILWFGKNLGILPLIIATASLSSIWTFIWYICIRKLIRYTFLHLLQDVFYYLLLAIISISMAYLVITDINNIYIRFFSAIISIITFYFITNYLTKSVILMDILTYLKDSFQIKKKW